MTVTKRSVSLDDSVAARVKRAADEDAPDSPLPRFLQPTGPVGAFLQIPTVANMGGHRPSVSQRSYQLTSGIDPRAKSASKHRISVDFGSRLPLPQKLRDRRSRTQAVRQPPRVGCGRTRAGDEFQAGLFDL
jgi:hypothetical protein